MIQSSSEFNPDLQPIVVLGTGVWGSCLATLARRNGYNVRLWGRQSVEPLAEGLAEAKMIVSAVSMKGVRNVVEQVKAVALPPKAILVTATKGLDSTDFQTPSQIWQTAFATHPVVVLAGPNLSVEIQQGLPAATTAASVDEQAAQQVQQVFSSPQFRVYTNPDPLGVELGGTLKNVLAIAAGVCDGLQLGTNAKAALVTRGLTEMIRLGTYFGAKPETFYGLSGLGDILATCNSALSRNYQVGYQLAQGLSLSEVLAQLQGTAEGVNTTAAVVAIASHQGISTPITAQVYRLLQGQITPKAAVTELMLRDVKPETIH